MSKMNAVIDKILYNKKDEKEQNQALSDCLFDLWCTLDDLINNENIATMLYKMGKFDIISQAADQIFDTADDFDEHIKV